MVIALLLFVSDVTSSVHVRAVGPGRRLVDTVGILPSSANMPGRPNAAKPERSSYNKTIFNSMEDEDEECVVDADSGLHV